MRGASRATPRAVTSHSGTALVKVINATLPKIPVSASNPTGPATSRASTSRDRAFRGARSWGGTTTSISRPMTTAGSISQGVAPRPTVETRASAMTGPSATPIVPPVVKRPTARPACRPPAVRAMLAPTGWKAAEPSPPTRSRPHSTGVVGATPTKWVAGQSS